MKKDPKASRDKRLTVEELEKRIAPSTATKKVPNPPPYAPGTKYGLVQRTNLRDGKLTVEELEKRIAPSTAAKKVPNPPPYAPGTDYGLVRRDNLSW